MLHGSLLIIERLGLIRLIERLPRLARHVYVLLCVLLSWVLFRAETLPATGYFLKSLFTPVPASINAQPFTFFINLELILVIIMGIVGSSTLVRRTWRFIVSHSPRQFEEVGATLATVMLIVICSVQMAGSTYNPFIYFRF